MFEIQSKGLLFWFFRILVFVLFRQSCPKSTADFYQNSPHFVNKTRTICLAFKLVKLVKCDFFGVIFKDLYCFDFCQFWFHEKKCQNYLVRKIRESKAVLYYLTVDKFWFNEKLFKNCLIGKIRENNFPHFLSSCRSQWSKLVQIERKIDKIERNDMITKNDKNDEQYKNDTTDKKWQNWQKWQLTKLTEMK